MQKGPVGLTGSSLAIANCLRFAARNISGTPLRSRWMRTSHFLSKASLVNCVFQLRHKSLPFIFVKSTNRQGTIFSGDSLRAQFSVESLDQFMANTWNYLQNILMGWGHLSCAFPANPGWVCIVYGDIFFGVEDGTLKDKIVNKKFWYAKKIPICKKKVSKRS